ncbi:MAG: U32 family peptidase [Nanoarchaeota archaeon]|nr:U32 family peptidase [Nanoarchaeota archaeon]
MISNKPELLAPAGDPISLRVAIEAGADAVYFGIKELNMRANAKNFELKEIKKVVDLCHKNKVKAYLTLNTIIYQDETKKIENILKKAKQADIDAIIAWDFSILKLCNRLNLRIHLSTQASVSNYEAAEYYHKKFNIKRIVLARECTLEDIKKIIQKVKKNRLNLEIETFIHGAMCVSISGRCFLSQFLFNRSANRGDCLQPCRRSYIITDPEEKHQLQIQNNYILSPKDLCTLPFLDKLIKADISSFKIEGRNRSPEYVKTTTGCYREAIDSVKRNKKINKNSLLKKLKTVYNRGFSSGFFLARPIEEFTDAYGSKATKKKSYIGKVINYYPKPKAAEIKIETKQLKLKDNIMIQGPTTGIIEQNIASMQISRENIKSAKKGTNIAIKTKDRVRKNDKVYLISDA